jgi:hypothetical protein
MINLEQELEKKKQEIENYNLLCERLDNLTDKEKMKMYYKLGYLDGNYNLCNNFFTYFKKSKFCENIFKTNIADINDFRDKVVEQIADDYIVWHESDDCDANFKNDKEKQDYKFKVIGLLGELFNIFYLEKISSYRTDTGYRKRFKNVVPFNIFMKQKDWGADLICLDEQNDICVFQVKFYSSWSIKQGNKIELKKHCFGTMCETVRLIYNDFDYLKGHVFVTMLGKKTDDVSISLQNSPYKDSLTILDKDNYFNDLAGDLTVFTDFYKFLMKI